MRLASASKSSAVRKRASQIVGLPARSANSRYQEANFRSLCNLSAVAISRVSDEIILLLTFPHQVNSSPAVFGIVDICTIIKNEMRQEDTQSGTAAPSSRQVEVH
jgi:hypothetical protein